MTVQEWLGEDNQLGIDIFTSKYIQKNETLEDFFDRVSNGDPELKQLIIDKKFLFGGRALANRGVPKSGSFFNCYSYGYVEDDYDKIMEANTIIGKTFKTQGGQGLSLTKLRPKDAPIGERYFSDGIVPFMKLFNTTTEITAQAGSRKGALLMSLDIRHKQAKDFITIKSNLDEIRKANLSLEIDDEFMQAVEKFYETGEVITLNEVRYYGESNQHKVEYEIKPIELYRLMIQQAWDYGEPGCLFTERFRNYNLMEFCDDYQIENCNPCGR